MNVSIHSALNLDTLDERDKPFGNLGLIFYICVNQLYMLLKYTKKPVTVEAIIWTGDNVTEVLSFCNDCFSYMRNEENLLDISTLEGTMHASVGDYIIKGVKGEFYACKPDIFLMTYDKA